MIAQRIDRIEEKAYDEQRKDRRFQQEDNAEHDERIYPPRLSGNFIERGLYEEKANEKNNSYEVAQCGGNKHRIT